LACPEFEAERLFLGTTWGLSEVAGDTDMAYFAAQGSQEAYVLRLRRAEKKRLDLISFAVASDAAVESLARRLHAAGYRLISEPHRLEAPGGGYGFRCFDVDGRAIEISSNVATRPVRSLGLAESLPEALSHVVLYSPDIRRSVAFYESQLGFRVSDWVGCLMCFLRCNSLHHCLAFVPGPVSFNHAAFEMQDVDALMRGVGRLLREKVVLGWGPGRHTAGDNAFAYFQTPGGHVLEYTAEVARVDDATWKPAIYTPSPYVDDQWGSGVLGGSPQKLGFPVIDPGLWLAPP
jgi:catechol 2,3-dioxygenase-like lactoylglutathione lyase family enzyme